MKNNDSSLIPSSSASHHYPPKNVRYIMISLILFFGILIRILGIEWGISSDMLPQEPTYHPDEVLIYLNATSTYRNPNKYFFTFGGVFYYRVAYIIDRSIIKTNSTPVEAMRASMLRLRLMNIVFALLGAFFVAGIALTIQDKMVGILSVAFFLFFPAHTLSSHYVRGDIFLTLLCAISLFFSMQLARRGRLIYMLIASFFAGLSVATMLWGAAAVVAVFIAWLEYDHFKLSFRSIQKALFAGFLITITSFTAYLIGSIETFYYWDIFLESCQKPSQFTFPLTKLTNCALYGFGLPATILGYFGVWLLWKQKINKGNLTLVGYFLTGWFILGFHQSHAMRYLLFLSPVMAIGTAIALIHIYQKYPGKQTVALGAFVLFFTLQLSIGYVAPMAFSKDIRRVAGEWILHRIGTTKARVGVIKSYRADWTYQPRFPSNSQITLHTIDISEDNDMSMHLNGSLDYIVTTDIARKRASTYIMKNFFKKLEKGDSYKLVKTISPDKYSLSLPEIFHLKEPIDLYYHNFTFMIYQLRSDKKSQNKYEPN